MTAGMGQSFTYDGANRLKTAGNGNSSFGYDGDGTRVKKTENGTNTFYVKSSVLGQTVMEVSSTGVMRAFVYSGNKLVAMQGTDGQFYWLHTNHLGNARTMTDTNGNVAYGGQFDPYGQTLAEWSATGNTTLNTKKFTGYERDSATGLDYAQARMYNNARGRFMTPDLLGLKASDVKRPQTLNRYTYSYNDPVNYIDPTGLTPLSPGDMRFLCEKGIIGSWWCDGSTVVRAEGGIGRTEGATGGGGIGIEDIKIPTLRELLMKYIDNLLKNADCIAAIGEAKLREWRGNVDREDVKLYNRHQQAIIPEMGITVAQYWDRRSFWQRHANGAVVINGATYDKDGNLDPNGHFFDARKYNTIIINTTYESYTLIHEFLHWQVSGDHVAIADRDHLNLARFGYTVDNDDAAKDAINKFFSKGCK